MCDITKKVQLGVAPFSNRLGVIAAGEWNADSVYYSSNVIRQVMELSQAHYSQLSFLYLFVIRCNIHPSQRANSYNTDQCGISYTSSAVLNNEYAESDHASHR